MNNVVKCARCNKVLIAESFQHHACIVSYVGSKDIEVETFGKYIDEDGREVVVAYGIDGITYRFYQTDKEKIPIPFEPTKRKVTTSQPNGDVTEPTRINFIY